MALKPLVVLFVSLTRAREITFPPIAGYASQQIIPQGFMEPDITHAKFAGLTTYANLQYVHCLAPQGQEVEPFDIAILGAPFDTAVTARPGARFGPSGIRQGSRRMAPEAGWNIYTGENVLLDWAKIIDCGDAPLTVLDNTAALKQLDKAHQIVSARRTNSSQHTTPRIVTLGGDHTTTLSALRSVHQHFGPVSVIHFDSHLDTWDPEVLGGGISHYAGVNHGTFLHIAHEEGLIRNTSIHAGIRAPMVRPKGDLRNDRKCGFEILKAREIDRFGVSGVIERLKSRVAGTKVYISVDIDVLDPAFAPATGTSEVGGWSTRELLSILDGLEGLDVVGADVVEVAPVYDNPGEVTVLAAAEVVLSLIGLMVKAPA
ncbi:Arginase/deacetylase [Pyrenophora tritici-repentis]|uniref:Arginase/deacetylase n=1 Tax=Pyrenophora tritici-repentis TaxID=45151 RepID=A0A2W1FAG2_9PLEO|nr:Arginase/deacetylase [Pyrenophora tritici-repentis]KAI0587526.1 Arginase/deacetylase [Pyrenophora tritici-repentis]KAI0590500.1 Arginase/deacetylase [Pyrenophora tritici-repentis]KAI0611427.1 Arginase/deacetylase [Pyrenophora tritici-repentis]KAI0626952.1 Arginase/deacetylase [Pyrenophora tritici-repentis]